MADTKTPSALLLAAADRIKDLAAAATPGPWFTHDTHLNAGGHTATVLSGTYPEGQLRAWLPTWSHKPWDEARNVWNDARWIAALSPAVGPDLSALLYALEGRDYDAARVIAQRLSARVLGEETDQ